MTWNQLVVTSAWCLSIASSLIAQVEALERIPPGSEALANRARELFRELPPLQRHYDGVTTNEVARRIMQDKKYREVQREKSQRIWFAALVSDQPEDRYSIQGRFETWKGFVEFLLEKNALVEVWAYAENGIDAPRRISANELAVLRKQRWEQPTYITASLRDEAIDPVKTYRVEFGYGAASAALKASESYRRHREIQLAAHNILSARDTKARFSATAQWEAISDAIEDGRFELSELPARPASNRDLFMAFEYEVDEFDNVVRAVRVYRESELKKEIISSKSDRTTQVLQLKPAGGQATRKVFAYRRHGTTDSLELVPNPIPGLDNVELRVRDPNEPDVRKWNVVAFGEPALVRESALAEFSLINAHLEKRRKERAIKKSNLDLIAEPIFTALNIGGGLAGFGFPAGESARLAYDLTVGVKYIPQVPTVAEMQRLFELLAAKANHPELKQRPMNLLDERDLPELRRSAEQLTEGQVREFMESISDDDLEGMLRLAQMQHIDAKVSTFLGIVSDASRVTAASRSSMLREIFTNPYYSVTGEIDLKNLIAVAVGAKTAVTGNGLTLKQLAEGKGPASAWLQFLSVTVDLRAVLNTFSRISHSSLADKELKQPFPYAPRMTDLAAYEVRIFGFPLLMFYKRGLLKDDYRAYTNDYAYGALGTRIVEHFPTQSDMDAEIRAGRMFALGYVRVPDGKGGWKDTSLAVFAHQIAAGRYKGRTAMVFYGLKAYAEQSQLIQREYSRFKQFESALDRGAVIERLVEAEDLKVVRRQEFEPRLNVGDASAEEEFSFLLADLMEYRRDRQRRRWGLPIDAHESREAERVRQRLVDRGVWVGDGEGDPLVEVDNRYFSRFRYQRQVDGKLRIVELTSIPSLERVRRGLAKAVELEQVERLRQSATASGGSGIALINQALEVNGHFEIGPLCRNASNDVLGVGVRVGREEISALLDQINRLPFAERAQLAMNQFSSTRLGLAVADGGPTNVFVTLEFPPDLSFEQRDPVSGNLEVLEYVNGLLIRKSTDRLIVEFQYDELETERGHRIFQNRGSRRLPERGPLLAESVTVDVWFNKPERTPVDPARPVARRVTVNLVTGKLACETYALYHEPITSADARHVTESRFDEYGRLESQTVRLNEAEGARHRTGADVLLDPRPTRVVYESTVRHDSNTDAQNGKRVVEQHDRIRGTSKVLTYDTANQGRLIAESYQDRLETNQVFDVGITYEYDEGAHFGLVPTRAVRRDAGSGILLATISTTSFDPHTRRLTATETDANGQSRVKTWDARWENAIEEVAGMRRTEFSYNLDGTAVTGRTVSVGSSEVLNRFDGVFDSNTGMWQIRREVWQQSGIILRRETESRSVFGKLAVTRTGGEIENIPIYNPAGIEVARETRLIDRITGRSTELLRREDDYRWNEGRRDARVQTYVGGRAYDDYRAISDEEGRVVVDGVRQLPGLNLRTVVMYEGASDRRVRIEVVQNGQVRQSSRFESPVRQSDGSFEIREVITPFWGLRFTNTLRLDDHWGRALRTDLENGESITVTDWYPGTAIPRFREVRDRRGQLKMRIERQLNESEETGIHFDTERTYRVGHWMQTGLADETAIVRGTDVALFRLREDDREYFDLRKPYLSTRYLIGRGNRDGFPVSIDGQDRLHVTGVVETQLTERAVPDLPVGTTEPVQIQNWVQLDGLFSHKVVRRTIDVAGHVIEERVGRMRNLGVPRYTEGALLDAAAKVYSTEANIYRYDRGSMFEIVDSSSAADRFFAFTNTTVTGNTDGQIVNDGRWRECVTRIESMRLESGGDTTNAIVQHMFRLAHSPRERTHNPWVPGRTNVWTTWTVSDFGSAGARLLDRELTFDAAGTVSVDRATKKVGSFQSGTRISYRIPGFNAETWSDSATNMGRVEPTIRIDPGSGDFSRSDFVYCYVSGATNPVLLIKDGAGKAARLRATPKSNQELSFWIPGSANVQWLPDSIDPRHGAAVDVPAVATESSGVLVISIADLIRAGLNVGDLRSFQLSWSAEAGGTMRSSSLFRLEPGDRSSGSTPGEAPSNEIVEHGSGLRTVLKAGPNRTRLEEIAGLKSDAVATFGARPVALVSTRKAHDVFPIAILVDEDDDASPQPLYVVSPYDGHFLERLDSSAGARNRLTYVAVNGFEVPRLEVQRPEFLRDEITPGLVAYGTDEPIALRRAVGGNIVTRTFARLHDRISANAFKLAGNGLIRQGIDRPAAAALDEFNRRTAGSAEADARRIERLPILAQALLPATTLPWQPGSAAGLEPPPDGPELRRFLQGRIQTASARAIGDHPKTGLIATAPGTPAERYVETIQEAAVIELAVKLGEIQLARQLLEFYAVRSAVGTEALHSSYEAETGSPQAYDPVALRSLHSSRTADAQIAIARAAASLGITSGDSGAVTLGVNLMKLVLTEFRPPGSGPRGISSRPIRETNNVHGLTFWPKPATYSVGCNARAYLVIKRLLQSGEAGLSGIAVSDRTFLEAASGELEDWLRQFALRPAIETGVVARGRFELQDIVDRTTATASDRWTSASDWLDLLESADEMGLPKATTRQLLEHLARLHGVRVGKAWGLDWSIALIRPDAISTELTARFVRIAKRLGHAEAAAFALDNLAALRTNGVWAAFVSHVDSTKPVATGQGTWVFGTVQPSTTDFSPLVFNELIGDAMPAAALTPPVAAVFPRVTTAISKGTADYVVFLVITGGFYLSILVVAAFWWRFRTARLSWMAEKKGEVDPAGVVPEEVLRLAEERWVKRVLGMCVPECTDHSRYANGPVECNFLMHLRAIHKLTLEWRRRERGCAANERQLVDAEDDEWLNGLDEFCCMAGIYMRWVIKAGAKDGFSRDHPLADNEDSNHIWSRLLLYFSEYRQGLLSLITRLRDCSGGHQRRDLNAQVVLLLNAMGMRKRADGFDARKRFDFPADPQAMDLLLLQKPETTLSDVVNATAERLDIPTKHIVGFIRKYKEFKRLENPYSIHPYLIEAAKVLPHFFLMAFGALVFYNNRTVGDQPLVPYVWDNIIIAFVFSPDFRLCGLVLLAGLALGVVAGAVRVYRWEATMLSRVKPEFVLDKTLTGLFSTTTLILPLLRTGWRWSAALYDYAGWILRVTGCVWLGLLLLGLNTPGFATFILVKGLLAPLMFTEAAAVMLPLGSNWLSKFIQDRSTRQRGAGKVVTWLNHLNITATRPASLVWQSLRYHYRPSVPSGDVTAMVQVVAVYFLLAVAFFFIGGTLCQEMFPLWFSAQYQTGADVKLLVGGVIFWITMYLLRYGLFVFVTGVASWVAGFPMKALMGMLASGWMGVASIAPQFDRSAALAAASPMIWAVAVVGMLLMIFEDNLVKAWRGFRQSRPQHPEGKQAPLAGSGSVRGDKLGVVYMSGDDLSFRKLTPDLLMSRWQLLRDRFGSEGQSSIVRMLKEPEDASLRKWFSNLYDAEQTSDVTLWHRSQLYVKGETPRYSAESGLSIPVESAEAREQLICAWHVRRWLVTMMSTAGHSQDTGVNLADIALRLEREGMSSRTVFYLVQNKYDNSDANRPSQCRYDREELGHRDKLARLLAAVAPGSRSVSLQNWTPFGFKAGGLTATDLVYEESLNLGALLLLDRNATVHDLDALMSDVQRMMSDPSAVIVIPGRSTTNTRTPIGQASQLVEEGHRSFLKGLMTFMGGRASESIGTGWGNILGVYYGPVQRAMVNPQTPEMPLTTRMRRGASFALRLEGLIGFGPHAVGISEDTWAVSQAAHNAVGLGLKPRFLMSHAFWHKIRETWSHSEWLNSFPRWSGGYLQMMHDPVMQHVNDFGPLSVFAKEARANSGRFYLTAMFTLLNIMLMPLAIILDVTPFVEILIVLWNLGFIMNQVLTVHGLQSYLEASGFRRLPALIGAILGGMVSAGVLRQESLTPAFAIFGFLAGGFVAGLGRWLNTRLRDVILFGPQLVLHALGQVIRQTLEFTLSGASPGDAESVNMGYRCAAGPREDRPWQRFAGLLNLRTVVWGVGFLSFALNLVALANLDLLNVLMLLPSLLFSVSAMVGPFVMAPPVGKCSRSGMIGARVLAWLSAITFYVAVSWLIAQGGALMCGGVAGIALIGVWLMYRVGQHLLYPGRIRRLTSELALLVRATAGEERASGLTQRILERAADGSAAVRTVLGNGGVSPDEQSAILQFVDRRLSPALRGPVSHGARLEIGSSRFGSEFRRSGIVALLVLIWLFLVPVPGLFVLSAGDYRVATHLGSILWIVLGGIGVVLATASVGRFLEDAELFGKSERGLIRRLTAVFRSLQSSGDLTDQEVASVFALLTDAQTFVDQRSPAYARRSVDLISKILNRRSQESK